jgi:hypothetical protein
MDVVQGQIAPGKFIEQLPVMMDVPAAKGAVRRIGVPHSREHIDKHCRMRERVNFAVPSCWSSRNHANPSEPAPNIRALLVGDSLVGSVPATTSS